MTVQQDFLTYPFFCSEINLENIEHLHQQCTEDMIT